MAKPCGCGHFGTVDKPTTDADWDGAAGNYSDEQYEFAAAGCDAGDDPPKQRCFLPHHEPDGTTNINGVHAAAQRITSLEDRDPDAVTAARDHLLAHYEALDEEPPDSLAAGGAMRTKPRKVTASGLVAATGEGWHAYLVIEGLRSNDHRRIADSALIWRELPLPLLWNPEGNDHWDSHVVGSIQTIERQDGGWIYATGVWDTGDTALEANRLVNDQMLRWVSIDLEVMESTFVEIGTPPPSPFDDLWLFDKGAVTADALEYDWYEEFTSARIMGAHLVAFPCFPQAVIGPAGTELAQVEPQIEGGTVAEPTMIACATNGAPPIGWFSDPCLDGPTPLTVAASGAVYGHLAVWGTCHTGFADACVCPPKSAKGYAYAMTGRVMTAEGAEVPVGQITLGTGHAPLSAGHRAAASHYDDTGSAVADVTFGEDSHGIWFSGALRPGVTDEQVHTLRASALSGDWRSIGGGLELVAALAVNVPGFPVVASGRMTVLPAYVEGPMAGIDRRSGRAEQVSLVAAGIARPDPMGPMQAALTAIDRRLRTVERLSEALAPDAVARITARVG